jgi:hypothetical protein
VTDKKTSIKKNALRCYNIEYICFTSNKLVPFLGFLPIYWEEVLIIEFLKLLKYSFNNHLYCLHCWVLLVEGGVFDVGAIGICDIHLQRNTVTSTTYMLVIENHRIIPKFRSVTQWQCAWRAKSSVSNNMNYHTTYSNPPSCLFISQE